MELVNRQKFSMSRKGVKDWAMVFRCFGNYNRLRILQLLKENDKLSVTQLSDELDISFKNTSRNLGILKHLGLVEAEGKRDRVYYSLNAEVASDLKRVLDSSIF